MTDKEIIKELEYQVKYGAGNPKALDLINRQQKEIERLKKGWKVDVIETQNIKTEAIKELETKIHEKLHEAEMHGNFEPVVTREMFDSVVKKVVGEGK